MVVDDAQCMQRWQWSVKLELEETSGTTVWSGHHVERPARAAGVLKVQPVLTARRKLLLAVLPILAVAGMLVCFTLSRSSKEADDGTFGGGSLRSMQ